MKKTIISSLLGVVILVGCATPNEMRQGKANLEVEGALPAKDVAKCIFDKWENDGPNSLVGLVSMRELKSGYMVAIANDGIVSVMADVLHSPENHSRTSVYGNSFGLPDIFLRLAKDCQQ